MSDIPVNNPKPVLWNLLDSGSGIANSTLGLDGKYLGGGSFTDGRFGNAFTAGVDDDDQVMFPLIGTINKTAGAIEFWARLTDFPDTIPVLGNPQLVHFDRPTSNHWDVGMGFNANDGIGGSGLNGGSTGNGTATGGSTYSDILGDAVNGWHHYAVVWDDAGIHGVSDGTRKVAIYLDGQMVSTHWATYQSASMGDAILADDYLRLIWNRGAQGTTSLDNLKIWDFAKTDFSDRNTEGLVLRADPNLPGQLAGTGAGDKLVGSRMDDDFKGGQGDDVLLGFGGGDRLNGGKGDDRIHGGIGDDKLFGGEGNDVLDGGRGSDVMIGGEGADRFIFRAGDSGLGLDRDRIHQFEVGQDLIDLSRIEGASAQIVQFTYLRFAVIVDEDTDGSFDFQFVVDVTGGTLTSNDLIF